MNEVPKTPIQVEVGIAFNPFADIKKFDSDTKGEAEIVLRVPLVFLGMRGEFSLSVYQSLLQDEEKGKTPAIDLLGEVGYNVRFEKGEFRVVETPLDIATSFEFTSEEQYDILSRHQVELEGGAAYLSLAHDQFSYEADPDIGEGNPSKTSGYNMEDSSGRYIEVILPDTLDRLAKLRVRFVERELDSEN